VFHIGALAPTLDSGAELLRRLAVRGAVRLGARPHPELTLSWAPLATDATPWQRGDVETVRAQLALSSVRLRQAGAHFFVCTDDTAYVPLEAPGAELAIPGLHAAPVVAAEAQRLGYARVGVLGTKWTLGWTRYADHLEPMGIAAVPLPLWDETTLHSIIFDELVHGRYSLHSRDVVLGILEGLRREGCQAVVMGCQELTSLVTPSSSPLPLLDTTALLADAALAVAVGDAPLPRWRGGLHESGAPTLQHDRAR
jgi:aspartate racemase